MADPASLTLGLVALAGLFSTCVECFNYVNSARSLGREYELLATKLKVEETRFLIWGDVVGILKIADQEHDPILDSPSVRKAVGRILNRVQDIFKNTDSLVSRYGLKQTFALGDVSNEAKLSANQLSKFKVSYKQYVRPLFKYGQRNTNLLGRTRWAIHDRVKFNVLVNDLRQLIDSLKDLTASPTNTMEQRQTITTEVEHLPIKAVKLIQEASAGLHEEWSDAATEALGNSVIDTEDQLNILDWIQDVSIDGDRNVELKKATDLLSANGLDVDEPGFKNVHWAAFNGNLELLQLLLNHGADIDARDEQSFTPLLRVAKVGQPSVARLLLEKGASTSAIQHHGWTALNEAAYNGHFEIIEHLLEHGADTEARDHKGFTSLIRAAKNGHTAMAQLLLKKGANTETKQHDGLTALNEAAYNGHLETVQHLLRHNADIEARDHQGFTPLIRAAEIGHSRMVQILLDKGAQIGAQQEHGFTPLIEAAHNGHVDTVNLLLEQGARL